MTIRRPSLILLLPVVLSLPFLAACRDGEARASVLAAEGEAPPPPDAIQPGGAVRADPHTGAMMSMSNEDMEMDGHGGVGMAAHMRMTTLRPARAVDRERADALVATLRDALAPYRDWHRAVADGFKPFLPNLPQRQIHFTNWRNGLAAAFRFDPTAPTSLLYRRTAAGYELVGAMYTAPQRWAEARLDDRVPLSVARWHQHVNFCLPPRGEGAAADWSRFGFAGSIATAADCQAAGGRFYPAVFGWMVHVYPWETDPARVWAHGDLNPATPAMPAMPAPRRRGERRDPAVAALRSPAARG